MLSLPQPQSAEFRKTLKHTFQRMLSKPRPDSFQTYLTIDKIQKLAKLLSQANYQLPISQQVQQIIKNLSQQQNEQQKIFTKLELQWIIDWILEKYYPHLQMFKQFCDNVDAVVDNQLNTREIIKNQSSNNNNIVFNIQIEIPSMILPLSNAKLIYNGAKPIYPVSGDDNNGDNIQCNEKENNQKQLLLQEQQKNVNNQNQEKQFQKMNE